MGFTKEDLKTGMVCKHRNGKLSMVANDTFQKKDNVIFAHNIRTDLNDFDRENFKWCFEEKNRSEYTKGIDIIEVYQPGNVCNGFIIFSGSDAEIEKEMKSWKVLWSEDSVEEMTLEDICKALGKNIKIGR